MAPFQKLTCLMHIQKLIEEADTDGSGEIEYDEFKQMFDT